MHRGDPIHAPPTSPRAAPRRASPYGQPIGYSIGFIRGIVSLIWIAAAVVLVGTIANELLGLGLAEDGYPALGSSTDLGAGGFLLRIGVVFAAGVALDFLLSRLEGGPLDPS